jgi:hypothetical protein
MSKNHTITSSSTLYCLIHGGGEEWGQERGKISLPSVCCHSSSYYDVTLCVVVGKDQREQLQLSYDYLYGFSVHF